MELQRSACSLAGTQESSLPEAAFIERDFTTETDLIMLQMSPQKSLNHKSSSCSTRGAEAVGIAAVQTPSQWLRACELLQGSGWSSQCGHLLVC